MPLAILFYSYQLLQLALLPFIPWYLLYRRLTGKPVFGALPERLGFIPKVVSDKPVIWFHACSVGEALSIQGIMEQIKTDIPHAQSYVTTGTISGKQMAVKHLDANYISLLPYDFLWSMLLAFKRIKPSILIIAEADFWPNLLMIAHRRNVPVYIVNGRMREKSLKRYKTFGWFLKPFLNPVTTFFVQSHQDKERFISFGLKNDQIRVMGDIKAATVWHKHASILKNKKDNPDTISSHPQFPIILAGSIHPGELTYYLDLLSALKPAHPTLKLILAPRHFHWREKLETQVQSSGFSYKIWDDSSPVLDPRLTLETHDILLVCKLGELFKLYELADIYCLGGTFVPIGGHNLLEPAVWGKPTIIGSHHQNCQVTADALEQSQGLIKVETKEELIAEVQTLLLKSELKKSMGNNAQSWLANEALQVGNEVSYFTKQIPQHLKNTI